MYPRRVLLNLAERREIFLAAILALEAFKIFKDSLYQSCLSLVMKSSSVF